MKKILILLGRGIEGCGITQCAIQTQKETGATIIALNDKLWPRKNSMQIDHLSLNMTNDFHYILKACNDHDYVFIYSVPSDSHPDTCKNNFNELIKRITTNKILFNYDHNKLSLIRNANFVEICKNVDLLMTHSLNNDFSKMINENNIKTLLCKMDLGFDFENHKKKFWKPINVKNQKTVRWIGRTAMWKGPDIIIDFHNQFLLQQGFITILEGLEASIQYKLVLYDKNGERRKVNNFFRPEKEYSETKFNEELHGKEKQKEHPYLYPQYVNEKCMERLSTSGFGCDLYHLKPNFYGNNIENCHAECIASGSIPIFHKHFCDNVIHNKIGKPISECKDSGTLGLDYSNFENVKNKMIKLIEDPVMYEDFRLASFEFWKDHCDIKNVTNKILETIKNNIL